MIDEFVDRHKLPSYREGQFNLAYYRQLIGSWDELTTWPKELRDRLGDEIPFMVLEPIRELVSADGKTIKVVFRRRAEYVKGLVGANRGRMEAGEQVVEAVLMRFDDGRNSVCVSCMVGCPVGCTFCATGKMGFGANLTSREIVEQVVYFARRLKDTAGNGEQVVGKKARTGNYKLQTEVNEVINPDKSIKTDRFGHGDESPRVTNVVFMGMGEPLLNLDEVMGAVEVMKSPEKLGIGERHITISTSGYVPQIRQLVERGFGGRLAVSLHAPNQELRQRLMPTVARVYPLGELMGVLDEYVKRTRKRVSYEYAMIEGVNDGPEQARELVGLLRGRLAHVNLIPYNKIDSHKKQVTSDKKQMIDNSRGESLSGDSYARSSVERIRAFANVLREAGINRTIRLTMGDDIAAACGQLAGGVKGK